MSFVNGLTRYYTFDSLSQFGVVQGVFTRQGGVSEGQWSSLNLGSTVGDDLGSVQVNKQRVFQSAQREINSLFDVWQVHSKVVVKASQPRKPEEPHAQADGIITNHPEITLLMRFADCVPLLFVDPVRKAIGLAHAGWKGTCLKVAAEVVAAMGSEFGSRPGDLYTCIGPSIGPDHYEVGEDVASQVRESFGEQAQNVLLPFNGHYKLDLWTANELILRQSGVRAIEQALLCTACHREDWYSHRAEHGKTGRFGVLIALKG